MYKLSKWNDLLDLSNFYAEAERRGFKILDEQSLTNTPRLTSVA